MLPVLRRTYTLLSPKERRQAAVVLAVIAGSAVVEVLGASSVLPFLQMAMDPGVIHTNPAFASVYDALGFRSDTDFLVAAGLALLGLTLFTNAYAFVANWMQVRFVHGLLHSISCRLFEGYLARPYPYFLQHNTATMNKVILHDGVEVVNGVVQPALNLISRGTIALALIALLIVVEPAATLGLLVVVGTLYAGLYFRIRHRLRALGDGSLQANQLRFQSSAEAFGGIKEMKVLGRERDFVRRYKAPSQVFHRNNARYTVLAQVPRYLIQSVTFSLLLGVVVVLLAAGRDIRQLIPVLGLFAVVGYRLMPAFQESLAALSKFKFNERLFDLLYEELVRNAPAERPPFRAEVPPLPFERELRFQGVTFRYEGAREPSLKGLDLVIPKNTSVAFVGATGAGKTTAVDLVLGLLVPHEGAVLVDGVPLDHANARRWQRNVGYVPQAIFLADDTVTRNIAFGVPDGEVDHAAVEAAAKVAHIHDFIATDLPQGYATLVGERGVRLSGGQRQRIGIARALYENPPVLVLDEATSDIDNVTQASITRAIDDLAGKKTLVVVAHRLSTIRNCDLICVLDRGQLVAQGSYAELFETSPHFRALAREAEAPLPA